MSTSIHAATTPPIDSDPGPSRAAAVRPGSLLWFMVALSPTSPSPRSSSETQDHRRARRYRMTVVWLVLAVFFCRAVGFDIQTHAISIDSEDSGSSKPLMDTAPDAKSQDQACDGRSRNAACARPSISDR